LDNFRLFTVKITALHEIVAQIVKFTGKWIRHITAFLFEPVRFAPRAIIVAGRGIDQDPLTL
jgi:hypothetical protein